MTFTDGEKIRACEREAALRKHVYAKQVTAGRMTKDNAVKGESIMHQIADDYRALPEQRKRMARMDRLITAFTPYLRHVPAVGMAEFWLDLKEYYLDTDQPPPPNPHDPANWPVDRADGA
jgi:hypothetical protein